MPPALKTKKTLQKPINKAVFFDRDGTLIKEQRGGYLSNPNKIKLYKSTLPALHLLKRAGFKIFIVSNQSGVRRGYFGEDKVKAVHARLVKILKPAAAPEGISYCPHAPQDNCACRKPKPKMGLDIIKKFNIAKSALYVVGDKKSDIDFGLNCGARGILVLTANGPRHKAKYEKEFKLNGVKFAKDLLSAAKYIISQDTAQNTAQNTARKTAQKSKKKQIFKTNGKTKGK